MPTKVTDSAIARSVRKSASVQLTSQRASSTYRRLPTSRIHQVTMVPVSPSHQSGSREGEVKNAT